ncbi:MAG: hypothetical protein EA350_10485 [Gemmatimonadales bacterium]|nr:MAG: hypothetical protein EA350_10485 [Gemmatimonadales bacterium]
MQTISSSAGLPLVGTRRLGVVAAMVAGLAFAPALDAQSSGQERSHDARVGLASGLTDAGEAAHNMELVINRSRPDGMYNPDNVGDGAFNNTDLAFQGNDVFVGNYNGFQVWDISDPSNPSLRVSVVCPGGQGDLSVYRNLLFMSVQETRARLDCGTQGAPGEVNPERFRGVRIFDITDVENPVQVAAVQTCRGSHTHTVVRDMKDESRIFVYNSGTSGVRPAEELAGCVPDPDPTNPETSFYSIDVIEVPLTNPEDARIVGSPRVFQDYETGDIAGLWPGGDHGAGTQESRTTHQCHDITAYPEIGLAAGACAGNGILFDISDPANPVRLDEVVDESFAYWHSATFNNDGSTVIFTDEWGGGGQARCRAEDPMEWGANAIYEIVDGQLEFRSYYKMPAPQSETENCVAHNGSIVPVPGRDIKVQAWYQGGVSVFDFTDPANPFEIAFFDRGPISETELLTGGYWSTYWYNGMVYGSAIIRGFDVLRLLPSEYLSENELEAAKLVRFGEFNPQHQPTKRWPPAFVVAKAYLDQLERGAGLSSARIASLRGELDRLEGMGAGAARTEELTRLARQLDSEARNASDGARVRALAVSLRDLAGAVE